MHDHLRGILQLSGFALSLAFVYFSGKSRASKEDREKLAQLNGRSQSRFRLSFDWWGHRLKATALANPEPTDDEAIEIGRSYWLNDAKVRANLGGHEMISIYSAAGKQTLLLVMGHRDSKVVLATFRSSIPWLGFLYGKRLSKMTEID